MKRYRFDAAIQRSTGWGAFVLFPHNSEAEFHIKGRVPVQALLGGLPYTGSLMPSAAGYHRLAVPRTICKQLSKAPGDLIRIELWKDEAPRSLEMPPDFTHLLQRENLLPEFEALSLTRRKEYRNWILSAKRAETRSRRLIKALEFLRKEGKTRKAAPKRPRSLA
jgi:hypothetical protein